jgi:type VI secretion system protein ImpG
MNEELLDYYERELTYLHEMGSEFARKHPQEAGRLLLGPDRCEDPHVKRLLEGFAFLAARVHRRLDDDLPEVAETLTKIIHPGYLRPVPSMTIVEFGTDPAQGKKTAGLHVPRGTTLESKLRVDGLSCSFQSAYDVNLWPIFVAEAEWRHPQRMKLPIRSQDGRQVAAAARVLLRCHKDVQFSDLSMSSLRFHLSGDPKTAFALYELLSENCIEIQLREAKAEGRIVRLEPNQIRPVGFSKDESLLPYERRSNDGHRLLQEYFALPEKFLFFDLGGLEPLASFGLSEEVEIVFLFSAFERAEWQQSLEQGVTIQTFRLGCTPAINLFSQLAVPIPLTHTRHEYLVEPDSRNADLMEVFAIEEVTANIPRLGHSVEVQPLYAYRHQVQKKVKEPFWVSTRKLNEFDNREPSRMYLSLVDPAGEFTDPDADVLLVRTQSTNCDLPTRLHIGVVTGDFEAVDFAAVHTVIALRQPTLSVRPNIGSRHLWRLISLLSLNYLSLNEEGRGAMQEILRLHNLTDSVGSEEKISALLEMASSPKFALVESEHGLVPARGTCVTMLFDEQQFAGRELYLFAAVLDRFLAGYTSINSFSQLSVRSKLRKEDLGRWRPRAGTQTLL